MQDFPYVLSEFEEINSILYKPINSTQRIKYTCFNVSLNYIVLGSTSGSIYLFSREPCSFLQLIPLSEGAVSRVMISPDEKTIALATTRGSVCLVAVKPVPKLIAVSTEHIHEQINYLCWHDNSSEIYIGDAAGKVSVMVLSIFTVNGMFQAPACILMNLDSAIVQLSFSSPLLLVSTMTRCYICDTVQEQYKQIGNKARNGEFGACFYKTYLEESKSTSPAQREERIINKKRSFSFIPEGDAHVQEENSTKIFCARPGSRLWEVSANGIVMKTHQFKEALAIPPTTICKSNVRRSIHKRQTEQAWAPQSINFFHLFVISEKYLFSYTSSGLYVINPVSATVVLWCNELTNIVIAETIENKIYLMTSDGEFQCLTLSPLDSLILRLYNKKRYYECLEACLLYEPLLRNLISDAEVSQLCDIESKLQTLQDDRLSTVLRPVIHLLRSNLDTCPIKLDSGIVVVNSGNLDSKDEDNLRYKFVSKSRALRTNEVSSEVRSVTETKEMVGPSEIINSTSTVEKNSTTSEVNCNTDTSMNEETDNERMIKSTEDTSNSNNDITQRIQSDLEAIYTLASKIKPSATEVELEKLISDLDQRLNVIRDSYKALTELKSFLYEVVRSAELYYFNTLLENTSVQLVCSTNSSRITRQLLRAFVNINAQSHIKCDCGYPFPTSQLTEPKFLRIGRSLLRKFIDENEVECVNICIRVPYMWREYLPSYTEQKHVPTDLLRQCLQTRDNIVLSLLLPVLDAKQWSLTVTYLIQINEGKCLFCGKSVKRVNAEPFVDWTGVMREITKNHGPDTTMTLLTKLEKLIPQLTIDKSIFQSLVFTKILYQHGMKHTVDFNKSTLESSEYNTMCSTKVRDQLIKALEKDLRRPINKSIFGSGAHHWGMRYKNKSSTCPCCTLSLQTPVLLGNNGIAIFCCGHAYHVNCMIEKKLTTCNLHS